MENVEYSAQYHRPEVRRIYTRQIYTVVIVVVVVAATTTTTTTTTTVAVVA